jgi:phage-related protein
MAGPPASVGRPAVVVRLAKKVNFRKNGLTTVLKLSQMCYIRRMKWVIKYHDEKLQADVLALPPGILARYFHCTDRMLEFGPDLGMPHTRAMSMGLFELRLKSREGIGRVFYCTLVDRKIVMLHQFVKKTDKTPPKELALARKRMKEWKNADT